MKTAITIIWIVVVGLAIVLVIMPSKEEETVSKLKYDNCVDEMVLIVPDPNDTEARSAVLEECYEK